MEAKDLEPLVPLLADLAAKEAAESNALDAERRARVVAHDATEAKHAARTALMTALADVLGQIKAETT